MLHKTKLYKLLLCLTLFVVLMIAMVMNASTRGMWERFEDSDTGMGEGVPEAEAVMEGDGKMSSEYSMDSDVMENVPDMDADDSELLDGDRPDYENEDVVVYNADGEVEDGDPTVETFRAPLSVAHQGGSRDLTHKAEHRQSLRKQNVIDPAKDLLELEGFSGNMYAGF